MHSFWRLALLVACAQQSLTYPYGYPANESLSYPQPKKFQREVKMKLSPANESLAENIYESVSNTFDNGAQVLSEISTDAKTTIDYLSGVAMKLEGIFTGLINKIGGGGPSSGPYVGKKETELEARLAKLELEVKDDWSSARAIKNWGIEKEAAYALAGAKEELLRASRGKQLLGDKLEDINNGINEMLVVLADETKDIQTKAKPVVDAIEKVEKLLKTPEARAVSQGIASFIDGVSNLFKPECHWNYGRERYTKLSYNAREKYWIDDGWLRCLYYRGDSVDSVAGKLSQRTGAPYGVVEEYVYNNIVYG